MDNLEILNNLKENMYVKVTGANVKNDNGLYIVHADYSKPDPRYTLVSNQRCLYKIKQDGTLSKVKYNIYFIDERIIKKNENLNLEIITDLKIARKKLSNEIKEIESKEIIISFVKKENAVFEDGCLITFEKYLSFGYNQGFCKNRLFKVSLSKIGTLTLFELGKKGQYISTGKTILCTTRLKEKIMKDCVIIEKKFF